MSVMMIFIRRFGRDAVSDQGNGTGHDIEHGIEAVGNQRLRMADDPPGKFAGDQKDIRGEAALEAAVAGSGDADRTGTRGHISIIDNKPSRDTAGSWWESTWSAGL